MFARVSLMSEGKTNNTTNNRDGEIHPCFVMFSGVETVFWEAAEDPVRMSFA
jgi:hypothetical protein